MMRDIRHLDTSLLIHAWVKPFHYSQIKAYWSVHDPCHTVVVVTWLVNQNMILIINHATPIRISQIAACLSIVNHFLYFSSSPDAVTIRNPPYIRIISAINARIPNTQLIYHFTTLMNASCCPVHDQTTFTSCVHQPSVLSVNGLLSLTSVAHTKLLLTSITSNQKAQSFFNIIDTITKWN